MVAQLQHWANQGHKPLSQQNCTPFELEIRHPGAHKLRQTIILGTVVMLPPTG
jgi:hypothetical protein